MKLTADLILQSPQFTNALKDRELDLRGYKIPVIENLGATLDQFDTINLSDNDVKKLEGFPLLKRLKCLLLNNNRVCRIGEGLETCLPNLESIVLTNNSMQDLSDLEPLGSVQTLRYLSLMRNPITNKQNYRLYVIYSLPQVRVLDFQRIKQREREAAKRLFGGKKREKLLNGTEKNKTNKFVPGEPLAKGPDSEPVKQNPQKSNIAAIKAAISNAKSLEEVKKLEMLLKTGHVPDSESKTDQDETMVVDGI